MINGLIVGIVKDNKDPDGMHRVLVEFPVDGEENPNSSWARMISPMSGQERGLVMLPDIGTEVVLGFSYRTMSPYILGAVYNGNADKPEPYHNDDKENNLRVFWSRNDHMIIFDDTAGAEKVSLGAQASSRLDVKSGPIYQVLDSAEKTITEYCDKNTIWEAVEHISIKCKDLKIEASNSFEVEAGQTAVYKSGTSGKMDGGSMMTDKASKVDVNGGSPLSPKEVLPTPPHKHPPTK